MDEISNKTLAILLIAAIVISLGGTLISLNRLARIKVPMITGFYGLPEEAIVQLEITSLVQVNFTTDTIDWVSGYVTGGYGFCVLNSYDSSIGANCTGFTPVTTGLVLENVGNKNVTLNITMQKNAATFITGSSPVCKWNVSNKEAGSCPGIALTPGAWQTCATTAVVVCNSTGNGFLATDTTDTLKFDVLVQIPSDAAPGAKTNVMTASAAQI
ncbi:hypothetical protein FP803_01740 [Candidatus Woesearchaeota archaeon]|nr:hypothetical protein [Candidatus Woesearchaeota archaeon]